MNIYSTRPRVADLVFQVYSRPLHPELFDIVAVRRIEREDYDLSVHITRTGHVISWKHRGVFLTEVADAEQALSDLRRLLCHRLRGERGARLSLGDGFTYQMNFQVEILAPEIFVHIHDEILADGHKRGLLHNFQPHHRLALAPLGLIAVEARANCLLVAAFHTFPDEHTVVKSQTLIETK